MYRKILVWFGASGPGIRAFYVAGGPPKDGAELFVLAVVRRHAIADEVESRAVLDDSIEFYKGSLASLKDVTLTKGVKARFEVAVGDFAAHASRRALWSV